MRKLSGNLTPFAMLLPLALACAVYWQNPYGENCLMALSGISLGFTPALVGIVHGNRIQLRLSALLLGAGVLASGWIFGYRIRVGFLPAICSTSVYFLLGGMLLANALRADSPDTTPLQIQQGWAGALALVLLFFALSYAMQLFRAPALWAAYLLLPLAFGALMALPQCARRAPRILWLALTALSILGLAAIALAILTQAGFGAARASLGRRLNAMLFKKAGMQNITFCLLVEIGMLLRNAIPGAQPKELSVRRW